MLFYRLTQWNIDKECCTGYAVNKKQLHHSSLDELDGCICKDSSTLKLDVFNNC